MARQFGIDLANGKRDLNSILIGLSTALSVNNFDREGAQGVENGLSSER